MNQVKILEGILRLMEIARFTGSNRTGATPPPPDDT